jgi:hypothetical protein
MISAAMALALGMLPCADYEVKVCVAFVGHEHSFHFLRFVENVFIIDKGRYSKFSPSVAYHNPEFFGNIKHPIKPTRIIWRNTSKLVGELRAIHSQIRPTHFANFGAVNTCHAYQLCWRLPIISNAYTDTYPQFFGVFPFIGTWLYEGNTIKIKISAQLLSRSFSGDSVGLEGKAQGYNNPQKAKAAEPSSERCPPSRVSGCVRRLPLRAQIGISLVIAAFAWIALWRALRPFGLITIKLSDIRKGITYAAVSFCLFWLSGLLWLAGG